MVSERTRASRAIQHRLSFGESLISSKDVLETDLTSFLNEINTMYIKMVADYYVVQFNGKTIEPKMAIKWNQLMEFESIMIKGTGCCLTVALDDKFIGFRNTGKTF
jgi:hypothetical protein